MRRPSLNSEYTLVNQFDSTYWNTGDLEVYLNGILLDSVQLNYRILETTQPYYGYASYEPDLIRHGSRIITGELTLNLQRFSYMYSALQSFDSSTPVSPVVGHKDALLPLNTVQGTTDSVNTQNLTGNQAISYVAAKRQATYAAMGSTVAPLISPYSPLYAIEGKDQVLDIVLGGSLPNKSVLLYDPADTSDRYNAELSSVTEIPVDPSSLATGRRITGVSFSSEDMSMADDGRNYMQTFAFMAKSSILLTPNEINSSKLKNERVQAALQKMLDQNGRGYEDGTSTPRATEATLLDPGK